MSAPSLATQASPNGASINVKRRPDEVEIRKIHDTLQSIRRTEISDRRRHIFSFNFRLWRITYLYIHLVIHEVYRYFRWVVRTWWDVIHRTFKAFIFKPRNHPPRSKEAEAEHIRDVLSYILFAIGGTLVLPFFLVLCLILRFPPLTRLYYYWSGLFRGNLGLINSGNPNLFKALTVRQAEAAKIELAKSIDEPSKDTDDTRVFNYDIAKILLQISAVIFEHNSDAIRNAAFGGTDSSGEDFKSLEATGDVGIRNFCKQFGIEYHAVSELNNNSTAFCGVFWDPSSSWIIVALKGTGPTEFGDWVTDLNAAMERCDYIDGFSQVHKGFKNHVFPDKGRKPSEQEETRPYNTISKSIKALVSSLQPNLGAGKKVNIWVTGMSLGSATASLIYSRMLMKPHEIGDNAILRDAYLFGSPIVCDAQSVRAFNQKMLEGPRRTMWRVTSAHDFVATGLPQRGDYLHILDPEALDRPTTNYFDYAHLGTEIVLYDYPHSSSARGNHLKHNIKVKIYSYHFTREEVAAFNKKRGSQFGEKIREQIGVALQQIPLLGRFLAHSTVYYWDQLDRIALDDCEWTVY